MNKTTQTTLALVAMLALVGIGSMPVTGAVPADCSQDFEIPDSKPLLARSLDDQEGETGWIEVGSEITFVHVELESVGELAFGVFILDGNCQVVPSSMSDCDDDEKVETTSIFSPGTEVCELKEPGIYFFSILNSDGTTHSYRVWEE